MQYGISGVVCIAWTKLMAPSPADLPQWLCSVTLILTHLYYNGHCTGRRRNGQLWWIQSVYVHSDYRRQGFFRALYEHVVQQAKEESAVGIRLYVDTHNTKAQETVSHVYSPAPPP